ncbi:MAG: class I SAM-dependent methyltransferase [Pseudomonadota bacterium]
MEQAQYKLLEHRQKAHWWHRGRREILGSVLDRYLTRGAKSAIIEIGAGVGGNIDMLAQYGTVTAVEMDEASRDLLCEIYPDMPVRPGALPDAQMFEGQSFETAIMFDVLEHVEEEAASLRVIRDHVVPGGLLVISVPAYQWLWGQHDERVHHKRRYTSESLRTALEDAGWEVKHLGYFNALLFPLAVAARMKDRVSRSKVSTGSGVPNKYVNNLFYRVFRSETARVAKGGYPFGLSVVAVAQKRAVHA